jgi:uncharacterized protein (TIGR02145 family)
LGGDSKKVAKSGNNGSGKKMKSTSGWAENGNGDNSSGFSGLPGGYRSYSGSFNGIGNYGYWWSSTEYNTSDAYLHRLNHYSAYLSRGSGSKGLGLSVRCLRD